MLKALRTTTTLAHTLYPLYLLKLKFTATPLFNSRDQVSRLRTLHNGGLRVSLSRRCLRTPCLTPHVAQSLSELRSPSYSTHSSSQASQQWEQSPQNVSPSGSYPESASQAPTFNRPLSPTYNYSPTAASSVTGETSPTSDVVPPPRRRISPGSTRDQAAPPRATGNRPTGVQKCSSCKATSSPEWRKGPSGKKELCNA